MLVVEDYDAGRELLCEYLTASGYHVATASNGSEALERARTTLPRVILLDLSLPLISGWDVARALKDDSETRAICLIACTSHTTESEHRRALEAGCSRILTKPLDLDLLLAVLRTEFESD